jgi:hypothetical protein
MAELTKAESNGGDTLFKLTGVGFGSTQATFNSHVSVSTATGSHSNATISTWSDTVITGTLPANHATPSGKLYVVNYHTDFAGNSHAICSNAADYTIS